MSFTKSIILSAFLPGIQINSQTRISSSSSKFSTVRNPALSWDNATMLIPLQHRILSGSNKRRFGVCNVVETGGSPPSETACNILQWMGIIAAMVLPFLSTQWGPLLKIKNEVDAAVDMAEGIVEAVEKVADEVEKVAEEISDDLPEGGSLRRVVDFVEHVAERVSDDAHAVDAFIDKVQEMEENVEEYFESHGSGASMDQPSK